jgi:hypothetical protein
MSHEPTHYAATVTDERQTPCVERVIEDFKASVSEDASVLEESLTRRLSHVEFVPANPNAARASVVIGKAEGSSSRSSSRWERNRGSSWGQRRGTADSSPTFWRRRGKVG